jgi:7-cyano-7-deazaguanine synthase in queuosine biosynthesis
MTKKTVLLCWSGGLDSTRLACHYLEQGYSVHALTVSLLNNKEKLKREEAARQVMMEVYFKTADFKLIEGLEIYNPLSVSSPLRGDALRFQEFPAWMFALVAAVKREHDEVAVGYIGDDRVTASYSEQMLQVWKSFESLAFENWPPLKFPLLAFNKTWAYMTLPAQLREHVTWCNSAQAVSFCSHCDPCTKMISLGLQPSKDNS